MGLYSLYLQDILQVYIQSTMNLNCEFYICPPRELQSELKISKDTVLKVFKSLYGVPEANNY